MKVKELIDKLAADFPPDARVYIESEGAVSIEDAQVVAATDDGLAAVISATAAEDR